jgi:hypothetical protein
MKRYHMHTDKRYTAIKRMHTPTGQFCDNCRRRTTDTTVIQDETGNTYKVGPECASHLISGSAPTLFN